MLVGSTYASEHEGQVEQISVNAALAVVEDKSGMASVVWSLPLLKVTKLIPS